MRRTRASADGRRNAHLSGSHAKDTPAPWLNIWAPGAANVSVTFRQAPGQGEAASGQTWLILATLVGIAKAPLPVARVLPEERPMRGL